MTETRRGFFGQLLGGLAVALGVKAAAPAITTSITREYSWTAYGYRADGSYGSYKVKA
jgi:hypothetical protein